VTFELMRRLISTEIWGLLSKYCARKTVPKFVVSSYAAGVVMSQISLGIGIQPYLRYGIPHDMHQDSSNEAEKPKHPESIHFMH
jgi:hypothetical protein